MAYGLEQIDWARPWLAHLRAQGQPLAQSVSAGLSCAQALNAVRAPVRSVRFVSQAMLPVGVAYERFIFETGQVPTRDGLHDFFNGLIWLHFPQTKRRLNRLQAAQIASQTVVSAPSQGSTQAAVLESVRGPVRDAATVFDENAALLQAPDALWQALRAHDWAQLFGGVRPLWAQSCLLLFGHALLEKLVQPRKPITAHVYRVPQGLAPHQIDAWLAQDLSADRLAAKPFTPLPVLGVPGWWPDNTEPGFYADAQVFRPLPASRRATRVPIRHS